MYRSDLGAKDRGGAIVAVAAIHAALAFAVLQRWGDVIVDRPDAVMKTFDVEEVPPPIEEPPPPPPPQQRREAKPKDEEGGSPANIRSQATPIVAPKPLVEPQRPNPVAVTETPNQGAAPTQGAAPVRGPGTGTGGTGTGTGTGSGSGPGGAGGVAVPASLIRGISGRDYPPGIQRSWPRGGVIFLRLRIEPNGRPSQCDVMRGFGDRLADQWTCSLVLQRGLFRPARDARGNPVSAWFGYKQVDISR